MKLNLSEILNSSILTEGRKEEMYNKYKSDIEREREDSLGSNGISWSKYDGFVDENFMKETNYKYLPWVMKQYYENPTESNYEWDEILEAVNDFHEIVTRYPHLIHTKDINQYKSPAILDRTNNQAKEIIRKKEAEKQAKKDADIIFNDDRWMVVVPKTHEASCHYGTGTKWCTTMRDTPSYYENYTRDGVLYYLIDKHEVSQKKRKELYKIAILMRWNGNEEWYNAADNRIDSLQNTLEQLLPPGIFDTIDKDFERRKEDMKPKIDSDLFEAMFMSYFKAITNDKSTESEVIKIDDYVFNYDVFDEGDDYIKLIFGGILEEYDIGNINNDVFISFDFEEVDEGIMVRMNTSNIIEWEDADGYNIWRDRLPYGEENEVNNFVDLLFVSDRASVVRDGVIRLHSWMINEVTRVYRRFIDKREVGLIKLKGESDGLVYWRPRNSASSIKFNYPPRLDSLTYKFVEWVKNNPGTTIKEFYEDYLGDTRNPGHNSMFFGSITDAGIVVPKREGKRIGYHLGPNYEAWTQGKLVRNNRLGKSFRY